MMFTNKDSLKMIGMFLLLLFIAPVLAYGFMAWCKLLLLWLAFLPKVG